MKKMILTMLLLGMIGICGCQSTERFQAPKLLEPAAVEMDTAVASFSDMYRSLVYSGEVVPYVEEVVFKTEGILGSLEVTVGDEVKKDQILAVLDGEVIEKQIETLKEQIADEEKLGEFADRKALLDIEIAKLELEGMPLTGTERNEARSAKEISIERMETELEQTQQLRRLELEKKNALLAEYEKKLADNVIRAPFDGTVCYIIQLNVGDPVNSYVPIVCVADENSMRIQTEYISLTNISGADRLAARIGDKEYAVSYIPVDEGEYISGMLSGADIYSDFALEQTDDSIANGDFAAVILYYSSRENVLTIPVNSLYQDNSGKYVYIIEEGQRVRRSVKTGIANDVEAEILEGLKEGDVVYVKE